MMSHDEQVSAAAQKMLRYLDSRLTALRVQNDDDEGTRDWNVTLKIRAQIKEVKELRKQITAPALVVPKTDHIHD